MKKQLKILLLLLPFLAVTALVLLAVWNVAVQSLGCIPAFGLTTPTLRYYLEVFTNDDFISSVWVSLRIALWSSVLAAVLGVLLSTALIKCRKAKGGFLYAVRLPVLVPHAVAAVFIVQLCSQTGLIARAGYALGLLEDYSQFPQLLYTPSYLGTILAYLWKEIPFVAYFILAFMSAISETLGEAAENLGANPVRSFFEVTLPLSIPVISRAFLIIFIFSFGGYELPMLLCIFLPMAVVVLWSVTERWPWPGILPESFSLRTVKELLFGSFLPLLVPGTVFAMGIQITLIRMGLSDTIAGVVIVHLIAAVPYCIAIMTDVTAAVGAKLEEQAMVLGANSIRAFFHVTLPSILSSMSMGFILSYSQYFTTLMVGGGRVRTIALVLVPYIQSGDRALSAVYSVAFVGSALLVFFIFEGIIHAIGKRGTSK